MGKIVRGRQYPWGVIDILDEKHSDFSVLRSLLVTYMLELVDLTHDVHYERYRENRMFERNKENVSVNSPRFPMKASPSFLPPGDAGDCNVSRGGVHEAQALRAKDDEIQKLREQMMMMQQQLANSQLGDSRGPSAFGNTSQMSSKAYDNYPDREAGDAQHIVV